MKNRLLMLLAFILVILSCGCGAGNGTERPESRGSGTITSRDRGEELKKIDQNYLKSAGNGKKTEQLTYKHGDHTKNAVVYLPPDYNPKKNYNIIYLLGGVNSDETAFFGKAGESSALGNILDNTFNSGECVPLIVVNLAFYPDKNTRLGDKSLSVLLDDFRQELRYVIIPAVESKYSTFAPDTTPEGIAASREHRGISGFSMGGAVAWDIISTDLDYFSFCIPMAAGSLEDYSGNDYTGSVAEKLKASRSSLGEEKSGFHIFAAEGTDDVTYEYMEKLIDRFRTEYQDTFSFTTSGFPDGNICYLLKQGGKHDPEHARQYFYNGILAMNNILK